MITSIERKKIFPSFIFLVLYLLLCLNLCQAVTDNALEQTSGLELNVMTFNIRYGTANDGANSWSSRKEMAYNVLRKYNPGIVGMQEAYRFQIDDFRKALPKYNEIGVGRDDGKTKGEYSNILYRGDLYDVNESGTFWFSDTPEVPGSIHWSNACTRICTWARFIDKRSGKAFYIFNLHLDHVSQSSREKSVLLLVRRISERKHKDPFIVTGDFNAGENNNAIKYMKSQAKLGDGNIGPKENPFPMVDTFRVINPDVAEVCTLNGFRGIRKGDKIDYIFTTRNEKILDAQIIYDNNNGRYPSDHFPVTATIEIK